MLGFAAQWLAWRLRIPAILLLLLTGLVVGPALGVLNPDDTFGGLLFPFVSASVAIVLFEGGTSLDLRELPHLGRVVPLLIAVGGTVSWLLLTAMGIVLLDLDLGIAALLGAILVVTGPTVIGPLLEQVRPTQRVASVLRWEGILIDPVGAILAVLVFEGLIAAEGDNAPAVIARGIAESFGSGTAIGLAAAGVMLLLLRRYLLPDFLHQSATLAAVLGAFALANALHEESGLVAVVVMGIALATQRITPIDHILEFNETIRTLLISALFIVLAARLQPDDLQVIGPAEVIFVVIAIVAVRPVAVALSSLSSRLPRTERLFMAALAPRGIVAAAVSSVFSIRLTELDVAGASAIVPVTFLVILITILVYGTTAKPLARRLGVAEPEAHGVLMVGAHPWAQALARTLQEAGSRVLLVDTDRVSVSTARAEGLRAFHTNVLGERSLDEIDLSGLGYLVALTSNDEVNALAAQRFIGSFGRRNVFQLPPATTGRDVEDVSAHLRGRLLFEEGATYRSLTVRFDFGGSVVTFPLENDADLEAFRAEHPGGLPLFLLTESGEVQPFATDGAPRAPGMLVALVSSAPPT